MGRRRPSIGSIAGRLEGAFAGVWSMGELALALARPHEVLRDPHRDALRRDVEARGFHVPLERIELRMGRRGGVTGPNPYRRIDGRPSGRIVASLRRAPRRAKRLVVVCHCYGIPLPSVMSTLFGLGRIDADVVTNVMGHHQLGTFLVWPGSGLVSARMSSFVENLREAVTGVRALVRWLREREGYDEVAILGFSIGGQLALHLAHAGEVDRALLYCPVTSVRHTAKELGFMRTLAPALDPVLVRLHGGGFDDLPALADPLRMTLPIPEENLHVVVHEHDRLTPLHQIEPIRARYPNVGWTQLPGTHLVPLELAQLHRVVREHLLENAG